MLMFSSMQIKWKSCSQSERCTFGTAESLHWLFANNYQCWESCNRLNKVNEVLGEETARLQELVYLSLMHMKLAFIDSYMRYWYPNGWHDWYVLTLCCFFLSGFEVKLWSWDHKDHWATERNLFAAPNPFPTNISKPSQNEFVFFVWNYFIIWFNSISAQEDSACLCDHLASC